MRYSARKPLLFLAALALAGAALVSPAGVRAQGELKFSVVSSFFPAQVESRPFGPCHGGAAVDRAGNIYVSTDTPRGILVFGPDGKYQRHFGPDFIHGLQLRREADGEYLYCARPTRHEVLKMKTDGATVWTMGYPESSGKYTKAEEFNPTNIVALRDGTLFVADGYGKNWIHKYDKHRNYIKSFGGPGGSPAEEGKFNRCHGLAPDYRSGKPMLVVCNRESGRVEHWDTDGNFVKVLQSGLRMPACAHVRGDYVAIGELKGRVTILGKDNGIVAQIGDNPDTSQRANFPLDPAQWTEGIVNSPHGISFDRQGSVIVSEWSKFGRIEKFTRAR